MLMTLFSLFIRLVVTAISLAMRLALALAAVAGQILGLLISAIWRVWRNRQASKVPLRAPQQIESSAPQRQLPSEQPSTAFTPRTLRPRPKH
jgi:uncharacterized membrane protein YqjE